MKGSHFLFILAASFPECCVHLPAGSVVALRPSTASLAPLVKARAHCAAPCSPSAVAGTEVCGVMCGVTGVAS